MSQVQNYIRYGSAEEDPVPKCGWVKQNGEGEILECDCGTCSDEEMECEECEDIGTRCEGTGELCPDCYDDRLEHTRLVKEVNSEIKQKVKKIIRLTRIIKLPQEVIDKRLAPYLVDRRGANKEGEDWFGLY